MGALSAGSGRPSLTLLPRPGSEDHDEAWLAAIWERQAFDTRDLQTTSGVAFQVVYPGQRTGGAGPDFRDAILALPDGQLLRGDVEIHLVSQGWVQHGHDRDPAYNHVLLHVVRNATGRTYTSNGESVLTLELRERLDAAPDPEESPDSQLSYVVAPCRTVLPRLEPGTLSDRLRQLALERFAAKQAQFEGELAVVSPEQVLYAGLVEALGYSRNRLAFRLLAQSVPVAAVVSAGSPGRIEGLMAEAGGLAAPSGQCQAAGLAQRPASEYAWVTAGVAPDNWPLRRITQMSAILARTGGTLLDGMLGPLTDEPVRLAAVRATWHELLHEVGSQRADAMAINVLLPFGAAYGQATCQFGLAEAATAMFGAYPSEGGNQVTRYMRSYVLGLQGRVASGAAGEQALLHVWDRWCHEKVCAACPLGR